MSLDPTGVVAVGAWIAMTLLCAAMGLALVRLLTGPTLPDRVVALDLIAALTIGMIAVYTVATNQEVLLLVAMTLALLAFLGTVAFGRYFERGGKR